MPTSGRKDHLLRLARGTFQLNLQRAIDQARTETDELEGTIQLVVVLEFDLGIFK